jgi:hypothetical protein
MSDEGFHKLGFFSLGIVYGFLAFGCLICTAFMNRIGVLNCLIFGSICDTLYIFS